MLILLKVSPPRHSGTKTISKHNFELTAMMSNTDVPSEIDFWVKHVEALKTCSICLEPFGVAHVALRFTGEEACSHVFGHPCLREWTGTTNQNANKCPNCRCTLWKSEDPFHIMNIANGTDDGDFDAEEFLESLD